jgi:hypothetical protein
MTRLCSFISSSSGSIGVHLAESIMLDKSPALAHARGTQLLVTVPRLFEGWILLWR